MGAKAWWRARRSLIFSRKASATPSRLLTPSRAASRTEEVLVASRSSSPWDWELPPEGDACPAADADSTFFQEMAEEIRPTSATRCRCGREVRGVERAQGGGDGLLVTAPARASTPTSAFASRHLRGAQGAVFVDGALSSRSKGDTIVAEFLKILDDYVEKRYASRK